jgi:hypothetical protein
MASDNVVLIVSKEFLNRILVGLGEVASKFAIPVLKDIESQVQHAEVGAKHWVEAIEAHLVGVKLVAAKAAEAGIGSATPVATATPESPLVATA